MEPASPSVRRYERPGSGVIAATLFRRGWLPESPRAAVLLAHGYAEHSGRYEHVGTWLARKGYAVHAFDHQGHGRSSGRRGHVARFSFFLDDLEHILGLVRSEHPDLPIFLLGHSMGGLIVASFAVERAPDVAGFVTSGAALGFPEATPRSRLLLARILRAVAPRLSIASGLDPGGICSDPAVVEAYLADPLVYRTMTTSLAVELFRTVERTSPRGADVKRPLLALHGADDPICPPVGSEAFATAAGGRFVRYPGMRHEIFNEPSHPKVLGDVDHWLGEQLADRHLADRG